MGKIKPGCRSFIEEDEEEMGAGDREASRQEEA